MIKILIHGYYGAMGQVVKEQLDNYDVEVYGYDRQTSIPTVYTDLTDIPEVDVIIDFSHYSLIDTLLDYAVESKTPLVLCTTGLSDETIQKIDTCKNNVPIFKSGNMSLGINLLIELAKIGAKTLKNFDIEIVEKHHNKKIDSPSGTAKMISDGIKSVRDVTEKYGRSGIGKRETDEIGIHAIRGGTITGEHTVLFAGEDEVIELTHQAYSKSVFAKGAIDAAFYLIDKKTGLYDMTDLILGGINEL